jgi:hypothetical protein
MQYWGENMIIKCEDLFCGGYNSIYVSQVHYLDDEDALEAMHNWIERTTGKRLCTNWESWDGRMLTRSVSLYDRLN